MSELSKKALMKQIQMCDFIVFETALYLDTHKNDKEALAYYNTHRDMAKKYRMQYTELYGPLTITDNNNDKTWEWVTSKWPWEYGSEV